MEHKVGVLIFSTTLYETFVVRKKIQQDTVYNVKISSCEVPAVPVRF
jgi:hypothetical protein